MSIQFPAALSANEREVFEHASRSTWERGRARGETKWASVWLGLFVGAHSAPTMAFM
jgi:hypothetical protein